jgi:magnesium transporter
MLTVYVRGADGRITQAAEPRAALAQGGFVWVDFFAAAESDLSREEEQLIEAALGIDAPTPQERAAVEESARFYEEDASLVLTATLMGQRGEGAFVSDAVSFILVRDVLVTVRAITPRAFQIGQSRASARIERARHGGDVMLALLEGVVERIADILQETSREAKTVSGQIFVENDQVGQEILRAIGRLGTLTSLAHDSLSSLQRLIVFTHTVCARHNLDAGRLLAMEKDVQELERLAEARQDHLNFLLDGALGLVNAAQNNVLKALSLATIVFVPPTLIASFFGMNFASLAWLDKGWGPWAAAALMIVAPVLLFWLARLRRWF